MNSKFTYIQYMQQFAQAYECGSYGAEAFGETSCDTTTTATGPLAYTGDSLWITLTGAALLVLLPLAYFARKFITRKKN